MTKYLRKEHPVEAIFYDGSNHEEVYKWISEHAPRPCHRTDGQVLVFPSDHAQAEPGHWLVMGDKHLKVLSKSDFASRYKRSPVR